VITGPNMAGKSTILRQVAILVLMAHMGSYVPAEKASISLTDRIFTRVGALDNLAAGQSTFMVEMQETANILNSASSDSLVISTKSEGERAPSTVSRLPGQWRNTCTTAAYRRQNPFCHPLPRIDPSWRRAKERVRNYSIAVKEWNDDIIFLRKLVEGGTNRSYGIQVARLAGIPGDVVRRAKTILANIEGGEQGLDGRPVIARGAEDRKPGHRQLTLFKKPEQELVERLASVDISSMTPLEAINYLDCMKAKAAELIQ
jgi:DNA mismatch repair protein MutS